MLHGFVDFLNEELKRKQKNNPAYSMRSFANFLKIDSGSLSAILNRKIPLTLKRFEKLASKFNFSTSQVQAFKKEISQLNASPVAFKILEDDEVIILSKPYYSTILHLFDLKIFESSLGWISKAVGIEPDECQEALDRLERLKLIEKNESGEYIKLVDNIALPRGESEESKIALKELMRGYFSKSLDGIDNVEDDKRLHSGTIFSIKKSDLPEIVDQLRNVRAKILNSQNKVKDKDDVYLLSISMVPMTKIGSS